MAYMMGGRLDVPRTTLCVCGWGAKFAGLPAANAGIELHMAEAGDGGDHAVVIDGEGDREAQTHRLSEPRMLA